jgi:hypothetical protein
MARQISIERLVERLSKINTSTFLTQKLRREAGTAVLASMTRRIFQNGLGSDDQIIRYGYSKRPLRVLASKYRLQSATRTVLFKGGYSELRAKLGRQVAKVDLNLFGDLFKDVQYYDQKKSIVVAVSQVLSSKKLRGNEKRMNRKIGEASPKDKEVFRRVIEIEHFTNLNQLF